MTKKLEELLNIAPADDSTEAPPEIHPEEQKEQAMEVVEKVEHELKEVDTIESALAGVENLQLMIKKWMILLKNLKILLII